MLGPKIVKAMEPAKTGHLPAKETVIVLTCVMTVKAGIGIVPLPGTFAAKATAEAMETAPRPVTAKVAIEGDAPMAVANNGFSRNWNAGMP